MQRILLASLLCFVLMVTAGSVGAEVTDAAPGGFTIHQIETVPAPGAQVWQALTAELGSWWDPDHSYFGGRERFRFDATVGGAWIEDGGQGSWARHMVVVQADPPRLLRMRGGLGPLQGMAVTGALTFTLAEVEAGTRVEVIYAVGGYVPGGLESIAPAVDNVLGLQLERLRDYVERRLTK